MENIKLINEDCMEYLPMLSDETADLIFLDPSYNDWKVLCEEGLICQAVRLLKPTGNILLFTKQPFDYELRIEINHLFRREITWTFTNGGAWVSNRMPLVSTQKIYWCTVGKDFYFNPRTGLPYNEATPDKFKRKNKVFEGYEANGRLFQKSEEGTWIRDHYHFNKPATGKIPSKPKELIDIFINCFSKPGDTVLDPFMGSGIIGVSSLQARRKYIGIEIDQNIFNSAKEKITNNRP